MICHKNSQMRSPLKSCLSKAPSPFQSTYWGVPTRRVLNMYYTLTNTSRSGWHGLCEDHFLITKQVVVHFHVLVGV